MASPAHDQDRDIEASPLPQQQRSHSPHSPQDDYAPRNSGIGPALSIDSDASSQQGTDASHASHRDDEWGPQHACYPHLNPYVPISSPLYQSTRIIRVRRDWMVAGDLAPTFSGLYPDILMDAGLQEGEFRKVIETVNSDLITVFRPWGWRNVLDAVLGLVTGWLWDDLGFTYAKRGLKNIEDKLERWNAQQEKSVRAGSRADDLGRAGLGSRAGIGSRAEMSLAEEEAGVQAKFIGLRQSGYLSLDIQIPTPRIGEVAEEDGIGAADADADADGEAVERGRSEGRKSADN